MNENTFFMQENIYFCKKHHLIDFKEQILWSAFTSESEARYLTQYTLDTALVGRGVNVSYLLSLRYYNTQNPTHVNIQTCWTGNIAEENLLTEQSPINIISSIIYVQHTFI